MRDSILFFSFFKTIFNYPETRGGSLLEAPMAFLKNELKIVFSYDSIMTFGPLLKERGWVHNK